MLSSLPPFEPLPTCCRLSSASKAYARIFSRNALKMITKMKAARWLDNTAKELTTKQAAGCGPSRSPEGEKQNGLCTIRKASAK